MFNADTGEYAFDKQFFNSQWIIDANGCLILIGPMWAVRNRTFVSPYKLADDIQKYLNKVDRCVLTEAEAKIFSVKIIPDEEKGFSINKGFFIKRVREKRHDGKRNSGVHTGHEKTELKESPGDDRR